MKRISLLSCAMAFSVAGLTGCEGRISDLGIAEELPPSGPTPFDVPKIGSFRCEAATGSVPLTTSCRWTGLEPSAGPVKCTVDPGDGTAPYEVADCQGEGTQGHQFLSAGTFKVRILAVVNGRSAQATFTVVVDDKPNTAPTIASVDASPKAAAPPFNSTLSWSIADVDNEPLTCLIDVGDDGATDHTLTDCTSATTQVVAVANPGTLNVRLTVKDARGLTATQLIGLSGKIQVGDLSIAKTEWGQSVISTNPVLVGGKPALLRIHVLGASPNIAGVTVKAEGFQNGTSLGTVSLTGPASPPTAVADNDLSQQYRGTVPGAWLVPGVEIRIAVDPDDVLGESDEANNSVTLQPSVGAARDLFLTSVPVVHQGVTATIPNWEQEMQQLWPVKNVVNVTRAPYTYTGTLTPFPDSNGNTPWSGFLNQINSVRIADGSQRYYYGFARVTYGAGIQGIGFIGQPTAAGRDNSADTFTHELGHNLGRPHAPCGGVAGPDPSYPPNAPYNGGRIGSIGYNFVTNALVGNTTNFDLMGYCSPEWVSDYNYKKVQEFLNNKPPVATDLAPRISLMLVAGQISLGGKVTLQPIHRILSDRFQEAPAPRRFTLRLYADGQPHETPLPTMLTGEDPYTHYFTVLANDVGRIEAVEILDGAQVIYRKAAEPFEPSPSMLLEEESNQLTLTWDATRHRYAAVAHLSDEGRTTLALELTGGKAIVRTDGLEPGGRFEVTMGDGINSVREEVRR